MVCVPMSFRILGDQLNPLFAFCLHLFLSRVKTGKDGRKETKRVGHHYNFKRFVELSWVCLILNALRYLILEIFWNIGIRY